MSEELGLNEAISEVHAESIVESMFQKHSLFSGLSSADVRELIRFAKERTFEPGDVLFRQGDIAESLFFVEKGELEVRAEAEGVEEEVILATIGSGSVVGEMAILEGSHRSATVVALAETSAFVLEADVFRELRAERRAVVYRLILNLAKTMGDRRRQTDKRVAEVFADPAKHIDAFEGQLTQMLAQVRKA